MRLESQISSGDGRGPGVVRLDTANGDHGVRLLVLGFREQELEFPHFVARELHAGDVVALDVDLDVDAVGEVGEGPAVDRRREAPEVDPRRRLIRKEAVGPGRGWVQGGGEEGERRGRGGGEEGGCVTGERRYNKGGKE